MNLNDVSYEELKAELDRRNAISARKNSNSCDVMEIIEPPTKVNPQAVQEEQLRQKQEEIERLKAELEFKQMETRVINQQMRIEKEMQIMHNEMRDAIERDRPFREECHRRVLATMTNEQLSIFPWFRK